MEKNSWCPLIKDYCKGEICVCFFIWAKGTSDETPKCAHFGVTVNP